MSFNMQYIYDIMVSGVRKDTTTKWHLARNFFNTNEFPVVIKITSGTGDTGLTLTSKDDIEQWEEKLDRDAPWNPDKNMNENKTNSKEAIRKINKDHINPSHYKSFFGLEEELQWLEAIQYFAN